MEINATGIFGILLCSLAIIGFFTISALTFVYVILYLNIKERRENGVDYISRNTSNSNTDSSSI